MLAADWKIDNLSLYPHWLNQIVDQHHSEWLRNAYENDTSEQNIAAKLLERRTLMRKHMSDDLIPSTFVAHKSLRPIGTVSLIRYPKSLEPRRVWLTNLYVDLPFQYKGIGSALLSHAENFAYANGINELSLYTFDAKEYYINRGWQWLSSGELHGRKLDVFGKRQG